MAAFQRRQEGILEIRDAFFVANFCLHGLVCRDIPVMAVHGQEQDHIAVLPIPIVPVQELLGIGTGFGPLRRGDGDHGDAHIVALFHGLQSRRYFGLFGRCEQMGSVGQARCGRGSTSRRQDHNGHHQDCFFQPFPHRTRSPHNKPLPIMTNFARKYRTGTRTTARAAPYS